MRSTCNPTRNDRFCPGEVWEWVQVEPQLKLRCREGRMQIFGKARLEVRQQAEMARHGDNARNQTFRRLTADSPAALLLISVVAAPDEKYQ